ncbi:MAG: hypothetical protein ACQEVA_11445 [Myxococcota bacterium]
MLSRNSFRLALSLLVLLLLAAALPACRGTKKDKSVAEQDRMPAFLTEIPADTIFFIGTRDPVPERVMEALLGGADAVREITEDYDEEFAAEMRRALDVDEDSEESKSPREEFLLEEMGGEVSMEGLENIGIDSTPRFALYGLGTVPVFRFELSDGDRLRDVLDRYRRRFDPAWTRRDLAGVGYWEYAVPASTFEEDTDAAIEGDWEGKPDLARESGTEDPEAESTSFTLFRVTDDEVIVTFVTEDTREQALPYFLGIKKPTDSLATSKRISELTSRHGLERWIIAFFDIGTTVEILEDPTAAATTITERVLQAEDPWSDYSEACRRDTARLLKPMTVFYGGLREYTEDVTDITFGVELQEDAARRLAELRSGTPGYSTTFGQDAIFMAGWGVRTGEMVGLAADVAKSFQSDPLECEDFKEINTSSRSLATAKATMPPWASAIDGFSLILHSVGFELESDEQGKATTPIIKPRALAVLDTSKPTALVYFLQTFVPEVSNLNLQPDGVPVAIPGAAGAYKGLIEPVLFMTRDGIGASVGKDMQEPAVEILGDDEPVTSPIFVMRANLGEAARVTLDELDEVIDGAAENKEERGLTDKDIAQSKKLVADMHELFEDRHIVAGFSVEIDEFGALMSYRVEGSAWDIDWEEHFSGFDERFDALERVLGTYEEPPGPPADLGNTQGTINGSSSAPGPNPPAPESGGTGLTGTGEGGGGKAIEQSEQQKGDESDEDAKDDAGDTE